MISKKFIQMESGNAYGYTLARVYGFDLPAAFILTVIFHRMVKSKLIDRLPTDALAGRFLAYKRQNLILYLQHKYVVVIPSISAGISSYLVLDSMTHANKGLVHMLPILSNYYQVSFLNAQGYQLLEPSYHLFPFLAFYWVFISLFQEYSASPARENNNIL